MSEKGTTASSLNEQSVDPIAELDKKYPGFKKGPAYLRLEA